MIKSGLAEKLTRESLLIPFQPVDDRLIKSQKIPFVSYPYEWTFSQLKDAALATLKIQKISLEYGLSLKDASAYNIQFFLGKLVLIDLFSFEKYQEGAPWVAYRQFCQHFLAPLVLIAYKDFRLSQLLRSFIDGIPLDLASVLLPKYTWFNFSLISHIHLHAKSQKYFAGKGKKIDRQGMKLSRQAFLAIIDNLENTINNLRWKEKKSQWADYYNFTNYLPDAFLEKKKIVERFLSKSAPKTVWDLGANTGEFSRIAAKKNVFTVAFDSDPAAAEENYRQIKNNREENLLSLFSDLTNPSPSLGWASSERRSLVERGPADCLLVLAMVHHFAISNNLPFERISWFLSLIGRDLIIEFIPKQDSQAQRLLFSRKDIFVDYNKKNFEEAFSLYFKILESEEIKRSGRTIYFMRKR